MIMADIDNRIALVIPAYEPSGRLAALLEELVLGWPGPIVVVDDGSSASCSVVFDRARALGATVLVHGLNRGKGAALKTAFSYLLEQVPTVAGAVTADADGQHLPADIRAVARELGLHQDSLVLGCRRFDGNGVPARSKLGNNFMLGAMRVLCGVDVSDTQTGLRGLPASLMRRMLAVVRDGYEFETEMLVLARRAGGIFEVPITTVYEGDNEASHFRPVVDSLRVLGVLFSAFARYTLSSLCTSLLDWALFSALVLLWSHGVATSAAIVWATVVARVVSAFVNYMLNRNIVFKADNSSCSRSLCRYIALCAACMLASAALVLLISVALPIPVFIIKPFVDTALFFTNYRIQRSWVFE